MNLKPPINLNLPCEVCTKPKTSKSTMTQEVEAALDLLDLPVQNRQRNDISNEDLSFLADLKNQNQNSLICKFADKKKTMRRASSVI